MNSCHINTTIATKQKGPNKHDPTVKHHSLIWGDMTMNDLPFPAAAAEKAPFLESFHGNTLAEGAVRCQGTLVHCGSSNFTTGLWSALGFIQRHLATSTELLVDSVDYLLGAYWTVSCANFPSPLVTTLHLWWFGPQKHHLPLTRKDSQLLTNCPQDLSPFKSFHDTKFNIEERKHWNNNSCLSKHYAHQTLQTTSKTFCKQNSSNKKKTADIGTTRLKHLNHLVQATEDSIHLIHPIIDFFILTWACWCHRSTWPYQHVEVVQFLFLQCQGVIIQQKWHGEPEFLGPFEGCCFFCFSSQFWLGWLSKNADEL